MAKPDSDKYPYHVNLIELKTDNPKNIRLYQNPSEMTRYLGSTVPDAAQSLTDFKKYGISERRIGINCFLDKSWPEKFSSPFKSLDKDTRNPHPDIIGNQTAFKSLLAPNSGPMLYLAKKCSGNHSVSLRLLLTPAKPQQDNEVRDSNPKEAQKPSSSLRVESDSISNETKSNTSDSNPDPDDNEQSSPSCSTQGPEQTTGFVLERVLSTRPDGGEIKYYQDMKTSLHGSFAATLEKRENLEAISILFTSEVDGLQYSEDRAARLSADQFQFTAEDLQSIVEVKSISTSLFYPRTAKDKEPHFYEQNVLRKYWAQGRLTGLDNLLCGVVHINQSPVRSVIKEVWNLSVQQIPSMLQTALKSKDAWKRPFPESVLSEDERTRTAANARFEAWTEIQCFEAFHQALNAIKLNMLDSRPGDLVYFVVHRGSISKVPEKHNKEMMRINSSVQFKVNHVRNQVIDTYQFRESVIGTFHEMGRCGRELKFLKAWSPEDMKLNRTLDKKSKTVYLKLMFKVESDATKFLATWTNPRRIKDHHIEASWLTPYCTMRTFW